MNLNAYDNITNKINKQLTWIDVNRKELLSREIKFRPYVVLSKRYNPELKQYDYFIILLDDRPVDKTCTRTKYDNYGRIKIGLKTLWEETTLANYEKDENISLTLVDSADDGDVYKLDI